RTAGLTQDAGEAGGGVERREARPVDRSVTRDERRALTVRQQRIVGGARPAVSSLASRPAPRKLHAGSTVSELLTGRSGRSRASSSWGIRRLPKNRSFPYPE